MWCVVEVKVHSFTCGYPVFSVQFIEKTIISPLINLGIPVKSQLTENVKAFFLFFTILYY